jgi:adenosylcobyric acid synthase
LRVALVRAPYAANLSDVIGLAREPAVSLRDVQCADDLAGADVVVLPGSKATIADLRWMRAGAIDAAILRHADAGGIVFGICGGMQMLGERIDDPVGVEGGGSALGLGLLPLDTELTPGKRVRRVSGVTNGRSFHGYEIHAGRSAVRGAPFAQLRSEPGGVYADDGAVAREGRIAGTYVHGVLDGDDLRHATIAAWRTARGLEPALRWSHHAAEREARIDRWAAHVAEAVDVDGLATLAGVAVSRS